MMTGSQAATGSHTAASTTDQDIEAGNSQADSEQSSAGDYC